MTDLLTALGGEAAPPGDGWYTLREIRAALGLGDKETYERLHALAEAGRLEAGSVLRRNLAGRMQSIPAYRLVSHVG